MSTVKLSFIQSRLGYRFTGDDKECEGIAFAECAKKREIAVALNSRQAISTRAEAVLIPPILADTDKSLIFSTEDPLTGAVKIARLFIEAGIVPDYSRTVNYEESAAGFFVGRNFKCADNAKIMPNVFIGDDVTIGSGVVIEPFVTVGSGSVIGENTVIHSGARIGANAFFTVGNDKLYAFAGIKRCIVGSGCDIGYNTVIQRGTFCDTVIGDYNKIGNLADIGHDVKIGDGNMICSEVGMAGGSRLGSGCMIYGQVGIANNVAVGDRVRIMAQSGVWKNIPDNSVISGRYGREHAEELRVQSKLRRMVK